MQGPVFFPSKNDEEKVSKNKVRNSMDEQFHFTLPSRRLQVFLFKHNIITQGTKSFDSWKNIHACNRAIHSSLKGAYVITADDKWKESIKFYLMLKKKFDSLQGDDVNMCTVQWELFIE